MSSSAPVNPYLFGKPIQNPADFYGRDMQLRDIFECIRKRGCANIVGERRSGKTSLLFHALHAETQRQYLPGDRDSLYVYVDAEIIPQDPWEFFREVFTKVKAQCPDLPISLDKPIDERQVRMYLEAMRPRRLVLLIDEFEGISQCDQFPPRFFVFLRGLSICYDISFVVATCKRLVECCSAEVLTSPFPNIFKTVELGPFTPEEFRHFVGQTASACSLTEVLEDIQSMAGYYPYLVQMACWHFFRAWSEHRNLGSGVRSLVRRRFEDESRSHFDSIWKYLSSEERETLTLMVRGEQAPRPNVVWRMEQKGYIREGRIFSDVLADYIRAQDAESPQLKEPEPKELVPHGLYVDDESGNVFRNGQVVEPPLTKDQYSLIKLLYEHQENICTPYMIVEAVWGEDYIAEVNDQRIAALVSRLRKRLEPEGKPWRYIITVHGRGLKLGDGTPIATSEDQNLQ